MKILAIETSCDDTGVAILDVKGAKTPVFSVLSNVIASQIEVHKQYGGVYPFAAKREHEKNLQPTLEAALKEAKVFQKDIDLIAVTNGPGLEPCLWVGVNFAKNLAKKWNVPLIPVNHIESHILVNFLNNELCSCECDRTDNCIKFPAICLVVSGGHTQLILMKGIGKYEILGETRDDAAGECFDKCAKILGLGYPGGPAIAQLALQWKFEIRNSKFEIKLPRPMMHTKDYDFSFSGLKTAVLYAWQKIKTKDNKRLFAVRQKAVNEQLTIEFAAEIQQAIIDVLLKKTIKAAKDYKAKTIILGGGVSANSELRRQFQEAVSKIYEIPCPRDRSNEVSSKKIKLLFPPANLSTDNAVMTAITGYFHRKDKVSIDIGSRTISADANISISK